MSIGRWWKGKDKDGKVDEWARNRLSAEVPEDSFSRVWAQVFRRIGSAPVVGQTSWELALTVRRLRLWTRVLAGGLAAATAILALVLLNAPGSERVEIQGRREDAELAAAMGKGLPDRFPSGETDYISYHLLHDRRIIYSRDLPKKGGW